MKPGRCLLLMALIVCAACASDAVPSSPEATVNAGLSGPWLPEPLAPGEGFDAFVEHACRETFATPQDGPGRHPQEVLDAPLVLTDARGQGIWHAMFGVPGENGGLCWNGEVELNRSVRRGEASLQLSWPSILAEEPEDSGVCIQAALDHTGDPVFTMPADSSPPAAWTVAGRAGPHVESVVIDVPKLGTVTPTFRDGWFLAWWPAMGDENFLVVGRDADGDEIATLDDDRLDAGFPCS